MKERRRQPRININWPIIATDGNSSVEGVAKNITLNGIFINCNEPIQIKKDISISIFSPNYKPIKVSGKIEWSDTYALDPDEKKEPLCIGLSFVKSSDKDRHLFKKIIDQVKNEEGSS